MSTNQPPGRRKLYGAADIVGIVSALWERAAPGMSDEEVEWFKKSTEVANAALKNFTAILRAIDTNALCDETSGAFKCTGTVSRMLFVFSDYVRYLEAMVLVGDFADGQLRYGCLPEQ